MLKMDLFDESGSFVGGPLFAETTSNAGSNDAFVPFSAHFTVPTEVLQRLVKNKLELAMLQKLGTLASAVEQNIDRLGSNRANTSAQAKVGILCSYFDYILRLCDSLQ